MCRDDRIRTCDPFVPNEVRYRAALHPETGVDGKSKTLHGFGKIEIMLRVLRRVMLRAVCRVRAR